jgi:FixJ family two-component response regulator
VRIHACQEASALIANPSPSDRPEDGGHQPEEGARSPLVSVLNRDLFFGVKIGNILRGVGYRVEFAKQTEEFAQKIQEASREPALGIVDINAGVDWSAIARLTSDQRATVPILAFGSHLDVDGMRAAKQSGVARVVSNGDFHRDMVKLVQRYALESPKPTPYLP